MRNKKVIDLMEKHNLPDGTRIMYGLEIERIAEDYAGQSKELLPDEVTTKQEHLQYVKDIGLFKDLQRHKDTTVGLYAFGQKIEDIFNEIPTECKTITEQLMLDKINYLKSIVFRIQ